MRRLRSANHAGNGVCLQQSTLWGVPASIMFDGYNYGGLAEWMKQIYPCLWLPAE